MDLLLRIFQPRFLNALLLLHLFSGTTQKAPTVCKFITKLFLALGFLLQCNLSLRKNTVPAQAQFMFTMLLPITNFSIIRQFQPKQVLQAPSPCKDILVIVQKVIAHLKMKQFYHYYD